MLNKSLYILTSVFLSILILFMSFWLSISEEKLHSWCQYHLDRTLTEQMKPEIIGIRTRFWGLEVAVIELRDNINQESLLKITDLKIQFDVISLIFRQELPFEFQSYGGTGKGALEVFPETKLKLGVSNLVLNWIPVVHGSRIIKSNPKLNFEGEFAPKTTSGNVHLAIKNLKVTGNKAHTTLAVNLPDTELASINADLSFNSNQLKLSIDTAGDISAKITGKIMGNWRRIRKSKVDLKLHADMKTAYQTKLGVFNNIIDSFRSKAGKISIRLTGNLMLPQIRKI